MGTQRDDDKPQGALDHWLNAFAEFFSEEQPRHQRAAPAPRPKGPCCTGKRTGATMPVVRRPKP